jgi:hypothetical protein
VSEKPLPPKPPASIKPSKLSMLASSRASTRSSRSSIWRRLQYLLTPPYDLLLKADYHSQPL